MISPELLRRYPFFGELDEAQLSAIAMISEEIDWQPGDTVFESNETATALYFLVEGSVELHYVVVDTMNPAKRKDYYVSDINPGEPLGLSALIEPFCYTAAARVSQACRAVKIDGVALRALCAKDIAVSAIIMRHTINALMSRLHDTRVQLVAAR